MVKEILSITYFKPNLRIRKHSLKKFTELTRTRKRTRFQIF